MDLIFSIFYKFGSGYEEKEKVVWAVEDGEPMIRMYYMKEISIFFLYIFSFFFLYILLYLFYIIYFTSHYHPFLSTLYSSMNFILPFHLSLLFWEVLLSKFLMGNLGSLHITLLLDKEHALLLKPDTAVHLGFGIHSKAGNKLRVNLFYSCWVHEDQSPHLLHMCREPKSSPC